jgi:hypothetical protein
MGIITKKSRLIIAFIILILMRLVEIKINSIDLAVFVIIDLALEVRSLAL